MIDRQSIVEVIQQIAREYNRPPGRQTFEKFSGVRRHEWYGRFWANWGEALLEAGLTPNQKTMPVSEAKLLADYLGIVSWLGRVPSDGEFILYTRRHPDFSSLSTYRGKFGTKHQLLKQLLTFGIAHDVPHDLLATIEVAIARTPIRLREHETTAAPEPRMSGYVYLIRSGRSYKIGRTSSIDRRQFEIGLQLPQKIEPIHAIRTDDPSGIEAYWHRRFKAKRLNGEWFSLTHTDVRDFKRRKFM